MYGLNVVLPGQIERLASDLHPELTGFDRIRERHTLVVKRFEDADVREIAGGARDPQARVDRLRERLRPVLAGVGPFRAAVTGIDCFVEPERGPGPVVYLAVESRGLDELHRRLCDEFGALPGFEGDEYVPHVTLARGNDVAAAERLADRDIDRLEWTVSELGLWSRQYREFAARIRLGG